MSGRKRWVNKGAKNVWEVRLSAWRWFADYVNQELLDYTTYIYRGHADSSWLLLPSLDRVVSSPTSPKRARHLENFQYAVRGRRGSHPPAIADDNGWWALGQHHGLSTPLLDWTESPFVALYFALEGCRGRASGDCCVWALSQSTAREVSARITDDDAIKPIAGRKPTVEIIRPMSDENGRLVNQRGLFTRGPNNVDMETWIDRYAPHDDGFIHLMKIMIPRAGADDCLRYLNRMNINHATLFPDLYGASIACNMDLLIPKY